MHRAFAATLRVSDPVRLVYSNGPTMIETGGHDERDGAID